MTADDIDNIFSYHAPFGDQASRYKSLLGEARQLARLIIGLCPESRERSLAITSLQQTIMWANAAIAINENHEAQQDAPVASFWRPECPFNYCDQEPPHTACLEYCRHITKTPAP